MSCLPFPIFVNNLPVDPDNKRAALAAVGRCRIYPATCSPSDYEKFRAICAKNKQQALVDTETPETKDEHKKLKKKYMKQGEAMASEYLRQTLKLDVSIVCVQMVMDGASIVESDGCLAACMLDAGCSHLVVDGLNTEAMNAAKVPRERMVAHFSEEAATPEAVAAALAFASTISVELKDNSVEFVDKILALVPKHHDQVSFQLQSPTSAEKKEPDEAFYENVATIAKKCKDNKGKIALVDPSADTLGLSYAACMRTDRPDGLYTTVVCTRNNEALGLVYSSKSSIIAALECGRGVYYSRSRNGLWRKGDSSGHYQILHRIDLDCDGDALRFCVTQLGDDVKAFCHLNDFTCWGKPWGVRHLEETLTDRLANAPEGSYTKRLFDDADLLRDKLVEEAQELAEAEEKDDVAGELADVLYFAMARAVKAGVSLDDAIAELDRRARKVTRRKGDSKAFRIAAGKEILDKKNKE